MADRGHDAVGGDGLDVADRLWVLRAQGDDADASPGCLLPARVFRQARRPNMLQRMRSPRSVFRRDVGALHVDPDDRSCDEWLGVARVGDGPYTGHDVSRGGRAHGRTDAGDAARPQRANHRSDLVGRGARGIHVVAGVPIDLDVDEAGGNPRSARGRGLLDSRQTRPLHRNPRASARLRQPALDVRHQASPLAVTRPRT